MNPAWQEVTGSSQIKSKEIEGWLVGPAPDGFAANVNVVTEQATGSHGAYVDAAVAVLNKQFTVLSRVDGTAFGTGFPGDFLTIVEYSGIVKGAANDRPLHLLAFITKHGAQAAIATLTTAESDFRTRRPQIEPYLARLRAT